ncbi:unnamed protein product, partial [Phaeothamnion confervicola]
MARKQWEGGLAGTIHIHEDDWGMRNLYPLAALPQALRDITGAVKAAQQSGAPEQSGGTDV